MSKFYATLKNILESNTCHEYSCLMLEIPKTTTDNLLDLISVDHLHEYGKEDEPHVTVKYGLHTKNHENVLDSVTNKFASLDLEIHNVSIFEQDKYDVLKLDVKSNNSIL